jgi:hypothetical protein
MLFVFPESSSGGFWMKNTLVPLRIVFFDRHGRPVRPVPDLRPRAPLPLRARAGGVGPAYREADRPAGRPAAPGPARQLTATGTIPR